MFLKLAHCYLDHAPVITFHLEFQQHDLANLQLFVAHLRHFTQIIIFQINIESYQVTYDCSCLGSGMVNHLSLVILYCCNKLSNLLMFLIILWCDQRKPASNAICINITGKINTKNFKKSHRFKNVNSRGFEPLPTKTRA